ncbi:MAG: Mur ligase family protein, partial [Arenicellales bacterium]|nr:Mur ligase family protein [Arenicellales bacterium]
MLDTAHGKDHRSLGQWLAYIESVHFRSIDLTLDRLEAVLHKILPDGLEYKVISVAGTNGKGSAVEMLTAIFSQAGFHVGTYTSPHLVSYAERIQVDRQMVSEAELCWAFETIEDARSDIPLTYFEFGTLAALLLFKQKGVQIAVLEVGMGGRLDAVNAVDSCATLITSVAIDHQLWLGADRESIAAEKAGIIRGGCPAVCSDPDTPDAVVEFATKAGASLYRIGEHFSYMDHGFSWDWIGPEDSYYGLPNLPLAGAFQLQNAAGVVMVVMALKKLIQVT